MAAPNFIGKSNDGARDAVPLGPNVFHFKKLKTRMHSSRMLPTAHLFPYPLEKIGITMSFAMETDLKQYPMNPPYKSSGGGVRPQDGPTIPMV